MRPIIGHRKLENTVCAMYSTGVQLKVRGAEGAEEWDNSDQVMVDEVRLVFLC